MATFKTDLPTMEELEHPDIPFSGVILKAGAMQLGKYCEDKNDEFMLCREELGPRCCIKEGKEVTNCTLEFFGKLKKLCYHQLDRYVNCIEKSSYDYDMQPCRKTQFALDQCILNNLNIKRPEFGYYSRPRVYQSERPAPIMHPQVFDEIPKGPDDAGFPDAEEPKFGSRWFAFR